MEVRNLKDTNIGKVDEKDRHVRNGMPAGMASGTEVRKANQNNDYAFKAVAVKVNDLTRNRHGAKKHCKQCNKGFRPDALLRHVCTFVDGEELSSRVILQ